MAGDKFNIKVSSWYKTNGATPNSPNSSLTDLVAALINGLSGPAGAAHGNITAAGLQSSDVLTPGVTDFLNNNEPNAGTKPRAYLNWILFDEQFKMVAASSGAEQVGDDGVFTVHVKSNLPITKNGYLYVYVSNETPNIDVFFDNLQVTHIKGQILEETHYYPFGLTMAGISDKAAGGLENRYKYNGIELDTSLGLDEYEATLRDLDPQTGRWWQIDPETEGQEMWSPYTSNNDNPILYKDPRGNEGEACCGGILQLGEDALEIYRAVRSGENIVDAAHSTPIKWKTVASGIFKALEGPEDLIKVNPKDLPINKDSKTATAPPQSVVLTLPPDTKVNTTKKDRVVNQKSGEKAQNQLEGIEKAQAKAKKNASSKGYKQSKINSTEKSKQYLKNELKSTKTAKDADKF